jgi:hypothetical protein
LASIKKTIVSVGAHVVDEGRNFNSDKEPEGGKDSARKEVIVPSLASLVTFADDQLAIIEDWTPMPN